MIRTAALVFAATLAGPVAAATLEVFGSPYPPLLLERQGGLGGPFAAAFEQLAHAQGIAVSYVSVPERRVLLETGHKADRCALGVPFDPGASETLSYVGPLAPITLAVYARRGALPRPIGNVSELGRYPVGALDGSEVRDILLTAGVPYQPLGDAAKGWRMLAADRFRLLVSDQPPPPDLPASAFVRVFTLARLERWVACQAGTAPATLAALRRALREGAFSAASRPIWQHYRLDSYYLAVRRDWATVRPGSTP
jgi:hypothetical protein